MKLLAAALVATGATTHALRLHGSSSLRSNRHANARPRLPSPAPPRLPFTSRLVVAVADGDGGEGDGDGDGEAAVVDKMREERLALLRGWGLEKRCG